MAMRWINVFAFAAVCMTAVYLYNFKTQTRELETDAAALERKIAKEREMISVLETEWSHLTRPERIERLAKQYLGLEAANSDQYVHEEQATGALPPLTKTGQIPKTDTQ